MKDTLTINGKLYVHTPDVKEDRLSGWVRAMQLKNGELAKITKEKHEHFDDTRMIQIREGEVIVSEDEVRNKLAKYIHTYVDMVDALKDLGFKKDGV